MRKLLLLLLVAGATIWMFKHPDDARRHVNTASSKLAGFFGSVADGSGEENLEEVPGQPGQPNGTSISKKPPPELPDGVYCLTQPVKFSYSNGFKIQPAGSLVRKKGESGSGKVLVTDEAGSVVVEASMLTRDPESIARYAQERAAAEQSRQALGEAALRQRLLEIDTKLASLKTELMSIQRRDLEARKYNRRVVFATSEAFILSAITSLEKTRAELLAAQQAP
jgi:hypothetical protein